VRRKVHKTALHCVGWVCITAGIVGFAIPFVPGSLFILFGLYFFSIASLWFAQKLDIYKLRFPKFAYAYARFDQKVSKYIKKAY